MPSLQMLDDFPFPLSSIFSHYSSSYRNGVYCVSKGTFSCMINRLISFHSKDMTYLFDHLEWTNWNGPFIQIRHPRVFASIVSWPRKRLRSTDSPLCHIFATWKVIVFTRREIFHIQRVQEMMAQSKYISSKYLINSSFKVVFRSIWFSCIGCGCFTPWAESKQIIASTLRNLFQMDFDESVEICFC